jgi:hypothetical protein
MKALDLLKAIFPASDLCLFALWASPALLASYQEDNFASFYYSGRAIEEIKNPLLVNCMNLTRFAAGVLGKPVAEFGNNVETYYLFEIEE